MHKSTRTAEDAFNSIVGYENIKQELRLLLDIMLNPQKYAQAGCKCPKGLLLHGSPGVGKTLMAECLMRAAQRPVFRCRKDQTSTEMIHAIEKTFKEAAENAPSIVFLDDMDKFANSDDRRRDAPEYAAVQSCIDKYRRDDVFVIATVNRMRHLPNSLYRSGRFDKVIKVPLPQYKDAVSIIEHYMQDKPVSGLDYNFIARIAQGHSCADIETVINTAAIKAGYQRCEAIGMDHIIEASVRCLYHISPVEEGKDCDDSEYDSDSIYSGRDEAQGSQLLQRSAYHEAGHAVLQELLFPHSVNFVTLQGKSGRIGGFMSVFRQASIPTADWNNAQIIVKMGGRAAVELKCGTANTCISDDLENAYDRLRELRELNALGPRFNSSLANVENDEDYRAVVTGRFTEAYHRAQQLLLQNIGYLERTAEYLAEHGQIDCQTMQSLKN